jgi:very-short-patch-repair endonuclease
VKIQKIKNTTQLRDYRKKLRRNSTSAEAELWNLLKGKKLEGRKFRRQYSISKYIIDFFCVSEQLAIELDGNPHGDYVINRRDEERENFLKNLGIKVIRFENKLVFQEPENVINTIKSVFKHN